MHTSDSTSAINPLDVFVEAQEVEEDDRTKFIDQRCVGDEELKERVYELLAADAAAGSFLEPGVIFRPDAPDAVLDEGTELGDFTIVREIGRGGMGIVYEARQKHPDRVVALKVIRPGFTSQAVVRRFENEANILAPLKHEGIAQVFSGGTAVVQDTRVPYFAMELVQEAHSIAEHAENEQIGLTERIDLFLKVCDAVHYGHRLGVIHRDLKPSNILVNQQGQPKIIDFGIALATDQDFASVTRYTSSGQLVGTPAYMSPEQVTRVASEIDIRTDVYSLGVVLYELLVGRAPYELEGRSLDDIVKTIKQTVPDLPSNFRGELRGDLDAICMKALEKDRSYRYESVAALVEDFRRHRAGLPIEARHHNRAYVVWRTAKRHAMALATTAGVFLVLLSLLIALLHSSRDLKRSIAQKDASLYVLGIREAQRAFNAGDTRRLREALAVCPKDERGWEWDYLSGRTDESELTFADTGTLIATVALSHNDSMVLTSGMYQPIRVWNAVSGDLLRTFDLPSEKIVDAAFSWNDQRVIAANFENVIRIWNTQKPARPILSEPQGGLASSLVASSKGDWFATTGTDNFVRVYSARDGHLERSWPLPAIDGAGIALDESESKLAAAVDTGVYRAWRIRPERSELPAAEGVGTAWELDFHPDGRRLACARGHHGATIFDVDTGNSVLDLPPEFGGTSAIAFGDAGRLLVSGHISGPIQIRDANDGRVIRRLNGHEGSVTDLAITKDAQWIFSASRDGTAKRWPLRSVGPHYVLRDHFRSVFDVEFSRDGKHLLSCGFDQALRLWNLETAALEAVWYGQDRVLRSASVSPDGSIVAAASGAGAIYLWNVRTGARTTLASPRSMHWAMLDFVDAHTLAALVDANLELWDVRTRERVSSRRICEERALVLKSYGVTNRLAVGCENGRVVIGSQSDMESVRPSGETSSLTTIAIGQNGRILAVGRASGIVELWDVKARALHWERSLYTGPVVSLTFDPSGGRLLAAGDLGPIELLRTSDGERLMQWTPETGRASAVDWSDDGRRIAVGSPEGPIEIFDIGSATGPTAAEKFDNLRAYEVTADLKNQGLLSEEVEDSLDSLPNLDTGVRASAYELLGLAGENPGCLSELAWDTVLNKNASAQEFALAYRRAWRALRLVPGNAMFLNTFGIAAIRVGKFEEAREALAAAVQRRGDALDHIGLAIAAYQLGNQEEADRSLAAGLDLMQSDGNAAAAHVQLFLAEAQALIHPDSVAPQKEAHGAPTQ